MEQNETDGEQEEAVDLRETDVVTETEDGEEKIQMAMLGDSAKEEDSGADDS